MNYSYSSSLNTPFNKTFSSLRQSMIVSVTEWVNRWDHGSIIFPLLRHQHYHPWRHFHIPPFPHPVPSTLLYPIEGTLFISFQSNQSLQGVSKPTRSARLKWTTDLPHLLLYERELQKPRAPFLSSVPHCYSHCVTGRQSTSRPLNSHISPQQTKWQEGRLLWEINKPCSNTDTHFKLGQLGF